MRAVLCLLVSLCVTACSLGINFDEIEGCSGDLIFDGDACVCPEGSVLVTDSSDRCACGVNYTKRDEAPFCACEAPFVERSEGGVTSCVCPESFVQDGDTCVCPEGTSLEGDACVCPATFSRYDEAPFCRCDAPLLEQVAADGSVVCGCPVALGAEGGVFRVSGEVPLSCSGRVEVVGDVLGDPSRRAADLSVLEVEGEEAWRIALLEETNALFAVRMYEVRVGESGAAELTAIGPAATIARSDDITPDLITQSGAVGVELVQLEGEYVPIVVLTDGSVQWVDYQDPAAPVVRPIAGSSAVGDLTSQPFTDAYRLRLIERWQPSDRSAASLIFNGTFYRSGVGPLSPSEQVAGFAELALDPSARTLSLTFGHTVIEDGPPGGLEFGSVIIGAVLFLSLDPLANNPDVFFASGVTARVYLGDDEESGCGITCTRIKELKPALYEVEYVPSLQQVVLRTGDDSGVSGGYAPLLSELAEPFVTEFAGEGTRSSDKFGFASVTALGRSLEVVSVGESVFTGCDINGEVRDCIADNGGKELTDVPVPTYKPTLLTFWDRGSTALTAVQTVSLDERLSGAMGILDNAVLGAPAETRLFVSLTYDRSTRERYIELLDVSATGGVEALVKVRLDSFIDLPRVLPSIYTSGALVLAPSSEGVRVVRFSSE